MKVILASQSPRRAALLDLIKIDFEVLPSSYEEKLDNSLDIEEQVKQLAYGKAINVFNNTQGDRTIIGADTIVVKDNKIYGKPKSREDAIKMLTEILASKERVTPGPKLPAKGLTLIQIKYPEEREDE